MIKHRTPQTEQQPDSHRYEGLLTWVQGLAVAELEGCRLPPEPLAGDASSRRFFRLQTAAGSLILVDAPPATEANTEYLALSSWYQKRGFRVPSIKAHHLEAGYFLVTDLGHKTYLDVLQRTPAQADALYDAAIDALVRLAEVGAAGGLPPYSLKRFTDELDLFVDWFVKAWLKQPLPAAWPQVKAVLIEAVTSQPKVCTHRDFHSRNLLVPPAPAEAAVENKNTNEQVSGIVDERALGIVDYQDSLYGPLSYDIASLIWDCYIDWPQADNLRRLQTYYNRLPEALRAECSEVDFERLAILTASQRHLKALGIFARLHVQENRRQYLASMPRVLDYLAYHLGDVSPDFCIWLKDHISPLVVREI